MFQISTDLSSIGRCVYNNDYRKLANFIADEVIIKDLTSELPIYGENVVDLLLEFIRVIKKLQKIKSYDLPMIQSEQILYFYMMDDDQTIMIKDHMSSVQGDIDGFRHAVDEISKSVVSFIHSKYDIDLEYLFEKKRKEMI